MGRWQAVLLLGIIHAHCIRAQIPNYYRDVIINHPQSSSVHEGKSIILQCSTDKDTPVKLCKWIWQSAHGDDPVIVEEFPAFGEQNTDCSLKINNATLPQRGFWTCAVQLQNETTLKSSPALLNVIKKIDFIDVPTNTSVAEGENLLLSCMTEDEIHECIWMFQPLNKTSAKPFKTFSAEKRRNCMLLVKKAQKDQSGLWSCGVRKLLIDEYSFTETAYVLVHDQEITVNFNETPVDTVFTVGSNGSMQCKTNEEILQCRWFWQPQGYSIEWQVIMREFPPEDGHDCSLHFKDITTEPEGIWMCAVLPYNSTIYIETEPVTLRLKTQFTVLTRAVVVAEGMETTLRCQTEADVAECRWRWHQLGEANEPSLVVREFQPYGPSNQDCSIQFTSMLMEQQGVWVCGVRLRDDTEFKEALPTSVSLKPAGRVRIIEVSQPKIIAEKEYLNLICTTSASVNECIWEWTPTNTNVTPDVIRFTPDKKDSRNCSFRIDKIEMKHDGYWKCSVRAEREKGIVKASTDPVKITVIKPVEIQFTNITTVLHVSPGSSRRLICEVSHKVESCQWKFLGKPVIKKAEFPPINGTDCGLNLIDLQVLNSGSWQCGVKNIGQYHYSWAPPTTLNVLHTENIVTSFWISEINNQLSLACHLETQLPLSIISCHWLHPSKINISLLNSTNSYNEYFDKSNGECILEFHSQTSDLGVWQCLYTVDTENGTWNLGEAEFLVLSNPHNLRLRWIVGILAATTVIMAIALGVVIIYGCPWTTVTAKDRLGKSNVPPPIPSKQSVRYTEEPAKINFHFQETPKLLVNLSGGSAPSSNHVYERVGQYVSPNVAKSIYQNIK
ncbi:uncharacterized protein LOC142323645 isoform X2 [Lycorma delicatula]|uniref:uncharacterized protein LOC142323645 isoform X2 n=1 Tax=Lycorma delicatula TaxID=130591 RepID=UPI003F512955